MQLHTVGMRNSLLLFFFTSPSNHVHYFFLAAKIGVHSQEVINPCIISKLLSYNRDNFKLESADSMLLNFRGSISS